MFAMTETLIQQLQGAMQFVMYNLEFIVTNMQLSKNYGVDQNWVVLT